MGYFLWIVPGPIPSWNNAWVPYTLRQTNIAMQNGPFETVSLIKNGDFHCYVSLLEDNPFVQKYSLSQGNGAKHLHVWKYMFSRGPAANARCQEEQAIQGVFNKGVY